jgi:hypothetical protein
MPSKSFSSLAPGGMIGSAAEAAVAPAERATARVNSSKDRMRVMVRVLGRLETVFNGMA